jgi:hypothetical protein
MTDDRAGVQKILPRLLLLPVRRQTLRPVPLRWPRIPVFFLPRHEGHDGIIPRNVKLSLSRRLIRIVRQSWTAPTGRSSWREKHDNTRREGHGHAQWHGSPNVGITPRWGWRDPEPRGLPSIDSAFHAPSTSCKDIAAAAGVFDVGIWVAFNGVCDGEAGGTEMGGHFIRLEEVEVDFWRELPGTIDHRGREIDAADVDALLVQVSGDVTGSAAHVADGADVADARGEPVEQLAVERLVPQFVEDAVDVLVGDKIVCVAAGIRFLRVHFTGLTIHAKNGEVGRHVGLNFNGKNSST